MNHSEWIALVAVVLTLIGGATSCLGVLIVMVSRLSRILFRVEQLEARYEERENRSDVIDAAVARIPLIEAGYSAQSAELGRFRSYIRELQVKAGVTEAIRASQGDIG